MGMATNGMAGVPSDWSDIRGCYDPLQYNGHPVGSDPAYRSIVNYVGPDGLILNPDHSRPESLEIDLIKNITSNTVSEDLADILEGKGTFSATPDGKTRSWQFSGPMLYAVSNPPTPFTYNAEVDITVLGAGLLRIHNFRRIPELPDHSMDADDTYLVQSDLKNCYLSQCTDNGNGTSQCVVKPYPPAAGAK